MHHYHSIDINTLQLVRLVRNSVDLNPYESCGTRKQHNVNNNSLLICNLTIFGFSPEHNLFNKTHGHGHGQNTCQI